VTLTVGYDIENLTDPERRKKYKGPVQVDGYGRRIPKHAHGTVNFDTRTSSTKIIVEGVLELFDNITNKDLLIRRINMSANNVLSEELALKEDRTEQLSIFDDLEEQAKLEQELEREKQVQHALLDIKKKFGKNAILKGVNLQEGATAQDRNRQIGGHKA
jgi:DNA polymerase V